MTEQDTKLLCAILAAHEAMARYEGAARITQHNVETVDGRLRERDPSGYLSEILRVGRQSSLLAELAKEAHDALVSAMEVAHG